MNGVPNVLKPIGTARTKVGLKEVCQSAALHQITQFEKACLAQNEAETFTVGGWCVPCGKEVLFLVDMNWGGRNGIPNWRERLVCPLCKMNNRQRLIATLIKQELFGSQGKQVYFMEQVTPIFLWASTTFKQHQLVGSEYLGHEYEGGAVVKGIRHEDVENLSFDDETLDLIISNDVFEHVPSPAKAFAECARALKPGGIMLATIPFHSDNDLSVIRAKLSDGKLEHILSPAFHGNPVSAEGSLVFTDFGWDLLQIIKNAGFSDVAIEVYASQDFAHFGGGQLVFKALR